MFSEAVCIMAELLLSLRQEHTARGMQLQQMERSYYAQVVDSRRQLLAMWREEAAGSANQQLQNMLASVSASGSGDGDGDGCSTDGSAVLRQQEEYLLITEWCQRMRLLEKNFELGIMVLDAEKQALMLELGLEPIGLADNSVPENNSIQQSQQLLQQQGDNATSAIGSIRRTFDISASASVDVGGMKFGGWSTEDHTMFLKVPAMLFQYFFLLL